jgi:hypothetical protein
MADGGWRSTEGKAASGNSEHPRDSAEPKGKTNVWPREGNRSEAEHKLEHETRWKLGECPATEDVADRIVRLPFYTSMTEEEQGRVIDEVKKLTPVEYGSHSTGRES